MRVSPTVWPFLLIIILSAIIAANGKDNNSRDNLHISTENEAEREDERPVARQATPDNGLDPNGANSSSGQTGSPFDYLYDYLIDNKLNKMCAIMRKANVEDMLGPVDGNYTLLAPSDEAFALMPGSKLDELSNNAERRREFVLRHIVPQRVALNKLRPNEETEAVALDGTRLHINAYPNGFVINGANVLTGDLPIGHTSNVLHVLDRHIYPPPESHLMGVIDSQPQLSQMSSFLILSGLDRELTKTSNAYTVFVPNDEAFRAISWPITQQMLSNNTFLRLLIANHVTPGKHYSSGLPGNQLYSIGGEVLQFNSKPVQSRELVLVNSVPIVSPDIIATNGVIHVITRLMLPKNLLEDCKCESKPSTERPPDDQTRPPFDPSVDPLLNDRPPEYPPPSNEFDRRTQSQSQPIRHQFPTTPKGVSFKTFWDDIFAPSQSDSTDTSPTEPQTRPTRRPILDPKGQSSTPTDQETTAPPTTESNLLADSPRDGENKSSSTPDMTTTSSPFFWDPFESIVDNITTEIDNFTFRPQSPPKSDNQTSNSSTTPPPPTESIPRSTRWEPSRRRTPTKSTPGVHYNDELKDEPQNNTSTTTTSSPSSSRPTRPRRPLYKPRPTPEVVSTQSTPDYETVNPSANDSSVPFRPSRRPHFKPQTPPSTDGQSSTDNPSNGSSSPRSPDRQRQPQSTAAAPQSHRRDPFQRRTDFEPSTPTVQQTIEQHDEENGSVQPSTERPRFVESTTRGWSWPTQSIPDDSQPQRIFSHRPPNDTLRPTPASSPTEPSDSQTPEQPRRRPYYRPGDARRTDDRDGQSSPPPRVRPYYPPKDDRTSPTDDSADAPQIDRRPKPQPFDSRTTETPRRVRPYYEPEASGPESGAVEPAIRQRPYTPSQRDDSQTPEEPIFNIQPYPYPPQDSRFPDRDSRPPEPQRPRPYSPREDRRQSPDDRQTPEPQQPQPRPRYQPEDRRPSQPSDRDDSPKTSTRDSQPRKESPHRPFDSASSQPTEAPQKQRPFYRPGDAARRERPDASSTTTTTTEPSRLRPYYPPSDRDGQPPEQPRVRPYYPPEDTRSSPSYRAEPTREPPRYRPYQPPDDSRRSPPTDHEAYTPEPRPTQRPYSQPPDEPVFNIQPYPYPPQDSRFPDRDSRPPEPQTEDRYPDRPFRPYGPPNEMTPSPYDPTRRPRPQSKAEIPKDSRQSPPARSDDRTSTPLAPPRSADKSPSTPIHPQKQSPADRHALRPGQRLRPVDYNNLRQYGEYPTSPAQRPPPARQTPTKGKTREPGQPSDRPSPTTKPKTIRQIIEDPNLIVDGKPQFFTVLRDCLSRGGLLSALDRPTTSLTIFMPTDEAFGALPEDTLDQLKQNPSALRKMLMQHMLSFALPPQNVRNDAVVQALTGDTHILNIIPGGKVLVDGVPVIAATTAENGVIYVINRPLYRPDGKSRTIMDELNKRPELSTFADIIQQTNYASRLKGPGPYTLFVPNNDAFDRSLSSLDEIANDPLAFKDFMRNHVSNGAHYTSELLSVPSVRSGSRTALTFSQTPDGQCLINNSSRIVSPDITSGNGVIHIIDAIVSPSDPFIKRRGDERNGRRDRYQADDGNEPNRAPKQTASQPSIQHMAQRLATKRFVNWLIKSGIVDDIIQDGRQYTIVAPTDRAVGKLPLKIQSVLNTDPKRVRNLLEYHIIPGFVNTTALDDDETLPTISGKDVRFNRPVNSTLKTISGAPIAREATHGNVMLVAVDNVLYPPQGDISAILAKSPILKSMLEIVRTAAMDEQLSQPGPYTLFAPKDEAIRQLDPNVLQKLKDDPNASRDFVRKHLLVSTLFTSALPLSQDGSKVWSVQSLNGDTLKFIRKPNCVSVNGVTFSYSDITATNGVVHVVDHVL